MAFEGHRLLRSGSLVEVALTVKAAVARRPSSAILVFDDRTGRVIDLDLRGTRAEVIERLSRQTPPGSRRGGSEESKRRNGAQQQRRAAQEAAYRFMLGIAGDLPGYEEGTRALFAGDRPRLEKWMADWPADIRTHVLRLAFS
jgi:hypothetical protein